MIQRTIFFGVLLSLHACEHEKGHPAIDSKETFAANRWQQADKLAPSDVNLINFSLFSNNTPYMNAKGKVRSHLKTPFADKVSQAEDRSIGIMLGMATADSLGSSFEFLPFKRSGYNIPGQKISMNKEQWTGYTEIAQNFQLKPGQWTDDTSMGLCLADVLLFYSGRLDDTQLMWSFVDWWDHGYNNAFAKDPKHSVGLGGNISLSLDEFKKLDLTRGSTGALPTMAGDKYTSGNGSLMRNGPTAIAAKSLEEAQKLAKQQSKVTHQGEEASATSELMSFILFHAIHDKEANPLVVKNNVFAKLKDFHSNVESVEALAMHKNNVANAKNKDIKENWDWMASDFSFSKDRVKQNPGYIGSYAMDALAMALHCVYSTDTFADAVLKAISSGGDADSVGAITGQIAGSIFGAKNIPNDWILAVQQWDRNGEIAARGYLLFKLNF